MVPLLVQSLCLQLDVLLLESVLVFLEVMLKTGDLHIIGVLKALQQILDLIVIIAELFIVQLVCDERMHGLVDLCILIQFDQHFTVEVNELLLVFWLKSLKDWSGL